MALVASLYPNWSLMAQLPVFYRHVKNKVDRLFSSMLSVTLSGWHGWWCHEPKIALSLTGAL